MITVVAWSLKIAFVGALVFVALECALCFTGVLVARLTGSFGMDASRPMWFVFYVGVWLVSFAVAYSIFPPFVRK
jgi:hypothetical protein